MKPKLIRITTIPDSLFILLNGQLKFMHQYFDVIAISSDGHLRESIEEREGVTTVAIEMTRKITPFNDLKAVWLLYRLFKKEKPAIVHTHTPKAGTVGMIAAYLAKVPIRIHTVAGLPLMETKGFKRIILNFVEKTTYHFATKICPNSKGLYDFIVSENFVSKDKLKVLGNGSSNGIDSQYFDPTLFPDTIKRAIRLQHRIPLNAFVFLFVGRLVSDKGINELVASFSVLCKEVKSKSLRLLLVGDFEKDLDPLTPETLNEIIENPNIVSVGFQDDVRPFFAASNAFVFPSYREGFPNVVMQAGAMGLPAIVSNINGCNEIIVEGDNGLIVPVKNISSLQDAMRYLIEEPSSYIELQKNARNLICSKYERSVMWGLLLKEYRYLLLEKNIRI